jgi:hypothetical protein
MISLPPAHLLNLTVSTVIARLHRARQKLHQSMGRTLLRPKSLGLPGSNQKKGGRRAFWVGVASLETSRLDPDGNDRPGLRMQREKEEKT